MPPKQKARPSEVVVRAYQVGFGDCFLVTFRYDDETEKHVLIDFGTTKLPPDAPKDQMKRIADDIATRCGGTLDAVIATHRHQDHISGFATGKGSSGDVIRSLKPGLVLQPWTEDPDLDPLATGPKTKKKSPSLSLRSVASLASMQLVAGAAARESGRLARYVLPSVSGEISFLGEDGLSNASAVKNLMTMGKNRYLHYGMKSGLESVLPGVSVTVLGPPTAEQAPGVDTERRKDADEYWHLTGRTLAAHGGKDGALFDVVKGTLPLRTRWFVSRVRNARADSLLELVRALDSVLNNTSLILLFEIGGAGILFPGDAQIENWSYALFDAEDREAHLKRLHNVRLYKVGHHGSLNATPKTLWALFDEKAGAGAAGRLKTVMSTIPGKHGHEDRGTEVPRKKLVTELVAESDLLDTEVYPDELSRTVSLKL